MGRYAALTNNTKAVIITGSSHHYLAGSGEDSQLLLWLCKSTSFLQDWQHVLQYLGTFAKKAEVQGTIAGTSPGFPIFAALISCLL